MKAIDMTEGSLKSAIIKFAIPMFLASMLQNLYNIADKIWVGRFLGKIQLTAVGTVGPVMFLILSLSIGMSIGTTVLISQSTGAKDKDGIIKAIDTSLIISVLISVIMTVIGLNYFEPVLRFMKTSEEVLSYTKAYIIAVILSTPFVFIINTVAAVLRGLGDSKSPTIIVGTAALINIILDPILITGINLFPSMGIFGVAVASIISQFIGFVLSCIKIIKIRKEYCKKKKIHFCKKLTALIMKLGIPATLQQGLLSIANMFILVIVNSYSNPDISSAFWAGHSFDTLAVLPAFAIGTALSAAAGQNTGIKSVERVSETSKIGIKYVSIINLIVTAVGFIFAPFIAKLFLPNDPGAVEQAVIYLRIFCFYYLPFGLMTALNSVAQGIGNTIFPMLITVLSVYAVRLPLAWYLAHHTNFGIKGVYIGMASSPVIGFLIIGLYFMRGKWKKRVERGQIV